MYKQVVRYSVELALQTNRRR